MKQKIWRPTVLLPLFYLLAVVLYLAVCLVVFAGVGVHTQKGEMPLHTLELGNFTQNSILRLDDRDGKQRFVSTDGDPQLIYATGRPFYVGRVTFAATSQRPGGEMVLYYTADEHFLATGFSERNKIWAEQTDDGRWTFDLDGRQVYALRLDPDTAGGIVWTVDDMQLNAPKGAASYFLPDAFGWFWLLVAPPLAAAVLVYLKQLVQSLRRFLQK